MDSTRMPLEVRVSSETITEIYRAEDFFGGQETTPDQVRREEADVWDEMSANVVNGRRRTPPVKRALRKRIFW